MKILYVTGHLRDADYIEHELHRLMPDSRMDVSPTVEDALHRLSEPEQYDAVLADAVLPDGDALRLIVHIRQRNLRLAVLVLIGTNDENPPLRALEAGADDYLLKRQNYVSRLPVMLMSAFDRYNPQQEQPAHTPQILFVGDIGMVPGQLRNLQEVHLHFARCRPDGSLEQMDGAPAENLPCDVVILDDTLAEAHVLQVLKDISVRTPDVPVILLTSPRNDDIGVQALKMGADDCIVKTEGYVGRLLLVVRKVVRHRGLLRERAALHAAEGRLRLLIETVPACITVLSCDGTFMAMNWSGLSTLGASRVDQVVGKNLRDFLSTDQERGLVEFLERVCSGEPGTMRFECECLDRTKRKLELRAVPLKRNADAKVTVLGSLHEVASLPAEVAAEEVTGAQQKQPGVGLPAAASPQGEDGEKEALRLRIDALERALKIEVSRYAQVAEALRLERERGGKARQALELAREQAEENSRALQQKLQDQKDSAATVEADLTSTKERLKNAEEELSRSWEISEARRALLEQEQWQWQAKFEKLYQELTQARADHERSENALRVAEAAQADLLEQCRNTQFEVQNTLAEFEKQTAVRQALEGSLFSAEAAQAQAAEERMQERAEAARQQRDWEQQRAGLEGSLNAAESRSAELEQQHQFECLRLRQAAEEAERRAASLEQTLQATVAHLAQQAEEAQAERAQAEHHRQEAEEHRASLEEALKLTEAKLAQLTEQRRATLAALDQAHHESEQKRSRLEESLKAAHSRLEAMEQEHQAERARLVHIVEELEPGRAALTEELNAAAARYTRLETEFQAERAELQRRLETAERELESVRQALAAAEGAAAGMSSEHEAECARFEAARQGLEQQRAALEEALKSAEARLEQQAGGHETARLGMEQAVQDLERQRAALQEALRAAEAQLAQSTEDCAAERSRHEAERRELEQCLEAAERRGRELEDGLRAAEEQQKEMTDSHAARLAAAYGERDQALEDARLRQEESQRREAQLAEIGAAMQRLQHQLREADGEKAALEDALRAAQTALAEAESYKHESARLELACREIESQRVALEEALRNAEAQLAAQAGELKNRLAQNDDLLRELEQVKAARITLESAVRTAETHRGQLVEESQLLRAQVERLQQEIEQHRSARLALEDALRAEEAARAQLSERNHFEHIAIEEAQRERDQLHTERDRLRELLREAAARYQELIRQRSENFQQLLRNTVTRCQQDAEAQLRLMSAQHQEEREGLEQLLREAESRQQQMDEQSMADRRRLETNLAELHAQYRRLVEYGSVGVAVTTPEGRLISCSDSFARIFGYANSRAALAHPDDWQARFLTDHKAAEFRLRSEGKITNIESCLRTADGRTLWVLEYAVVIAGRGDDAPVVERIFQDVTERHLLKEELRRARRTESVGKLATATVQTFNDLLTSMMGYSELLIEGLSEEDPRRRNAERVKKVAGQAGSLARQLLAYSRRQEREPDLLDLNAVLKRMEDLLHTLVGDDIEFAMELAPDLNLVSAERSEVEQVITAFVVNARDALPLGGSVRVETSNVTVDVTETGRSAEPYVLLSAGASGYGVQPMSYSPSVDAIIARYGGHIRTGYEPEKASTLRIFLPRVQPTEAADEILNQTGDEQDL